jgi:hypothetical protein
MRSKLKKEESKQKIKCETVKHKTNPFLKDLVINKKSKQVRVTNGLGKEDNVLINQKTGDEQQTNVVTYKQVDDAEFVKVFTANIGLTFNLKSAGIKSFNVLFWAVQNTAIQKDLVALDVLTLEDFIEANKNFKLSKATFYRGLKELVEAQIIAKSMRDGMYFINPNFVFNGDRIAFTTIIQRKSNERVLAEETKRLRDKNNKNVEQNKI